MRSMVEGHPRVFLTVLAKGVRRTSLCPSTTFGGPPLRTGEDKPAPIPQTPLPPSAATAKSSGKPHNPQQQSVPR